MNVQPPSGHLPPSHHEADVHEPYPGEMGSAGMAMAAPWGFGNPQQFLEQQGRKVWPYALIAALGGAIAGTLAGYMMGGVMCKVKKVVGR